jgi:hypothetical protein
MVKHYSNHDCVDISEKTTSQCDKLTKYYLNWTLLRFTSILMLEGNQLRLLNIISLLSVYLSQSKKKWWEFSHGAPQSQEAFDKMRKLQLLNNIQNGSASSYLLDLIPPTIQSTTIYSLRNGNDIIVPFCRLSLTRDSFVSATVREWNNLNLSVRNPFRRGYIVVLWIVGGIKSSK